MKINCECGKQIHDNADFLEYKGNVVGDQDWCLFKEDLEAILSDVAPKSDIPDVRLRILKALDPRWMWECPSCGRLYAEDKNHALVAYTPDETGYKGIFKRR